MPSETMEEKNMQELERKPNSSETMRVRCPHCRKLYLVQFGDIKETKPRFECVQCHNRFWLAMADMDFSAEVEGLPLQVKEAPRVKSRESVKSAADVQPCPKCFKPIHVRASECPSCGVVISKMKDLAFQEGSPSHSEALGTLWRKLIADYGNEALHAEFMRLAQRERNLPFAGAQYAQMLKLMPSDETTKKRVREVQALGSSMIPDVGRVTREPRAFSRVWQVPLALATMMMLVGMFIPVFRNMVGVGAAILFVALVLQIQSRRRN